MKANYHTHLQLCGHAEGMSEDYIKVAIEEGYEILGMSDHGPIKPEFMSKEDFIFNWLDRQMTYEDFLNIYLPDCQKTKEKYKDKIKFLIGVEIEYLSPFHSYYELLRKHLDYMNLAGHFYYHNNKIINITQIHIPSSSKKLSNISVHITKKTKTITINNPLPNILLFTPKNRDIVSSNLAMTFPPLNSLLN